jgi:hypothetical protein
MSVVVSVPNTTLRRAGSACLLLSLCMQLSPQVQAAPFPVRYTEGTVHGFLALRTGDGKTLASGTLTQQVRGNRVVGRLTLHFKDGSLDEEETAYLQRPNLQLIRYHHVQSGPTFPHPSDVSVDVAAGTVTVRSTEDGQTREKTSHLELTPELGNGLLVNVLKNLPVSTDFPVTELQCVIATPVPRIVTLEIRRGDEEAFESAGSEVKARRYDIAIKLGGVAGVVAPLVGKAPEDVHVWIVEGVAPAFVRMDGQLFAEGPIWTVELASPRLRDPPKPRY